MSAKDTCSAPACARLRGGIRNQAFPSARAGAVGHRVSRQNVGMPDADTPLAASPAVPLAARLDIVCLCAAWCGTCREYEAVFAELQRALPGHRYRWIDIEDEADLLGDIDVETFPTLVLAHAGQVLFAGPVLPRLGDAQRLVEVQRDALLRGGDARALSARALASLPADQAQAHAELAARLAS